MAEENNKLALLANPDNWIQGGTVSIEGGYQRQNEKLYALQTGLDTTNPIYDKKTYTIIIPQGGLIEAGCKLYKVENDILIEIEQSKRSFCNWLAVTPTGDGNAKFELVEKPGKWVHGKNGCYLDDGRRTLNWVTPGATLSTNTTEFPIYEKTNKGREEINLGKGWYIARLQSGAGGGNAVDTKGGIPVSGNLVSKVFFHNGGNLSIKVGGDGEGGGDGGTGGTGGNNQYGKAGDGGDGGGGGSGAGEDSGITGIINTGIKQAGKYSTGTSGNTSSGGGRGGIGGVASSPGNNGENGSISSGSSGQGGFGGLGGNHSGVINGGNGYNGNAAGGSGTGAGGGGGGGGGAGGRNGWEMDDGSPTSGFCKIFSLSG